MIKLKVPLTIICNQLYKKSMIGKKTFSHNIFLDIQKKKHTRTILRNILFLLENSYLFIIVIREKHRICFWNCISSLSLSCYNLEVKKTYLNLFVDRKYPYREVIRNQLILQRCGKLELVRFIIELFSMYIIIYCIIYNAWGF